MAASLSIQHAGRTGAPSSGRIRRSMLTWPSAFVALFAVSVFAKVFMTRITGIPQLGFILDLPFLIGAVYLVFRSIARGRLSSSGVVWLSALILMVVISEAGGNPVGLSNSMLASLLFCKMFMVFFISGKVNLANIRLAIYVIAFAHLTGLAINIAFPGIFNSLLPETSYQLDTSRLMGFSLNPNRSAAVSSVLALYFWFLDRNKFMAILLFIPMAFSESRSIMVAFLAIFVYLQYISGRTGGRFLIIPVLLIGGAVFYSFADLGDLSSKVDGTINGNLRYIRAAMLLGGAFLASQYFPFGNGGGTFGSPLSYGSGAYDAVGIGTWDTVVDGGGIFDSGIGTILGEYGAIGIVAVVTFLFLTFRPNRANGFKTIDAMFLVGLVIFLSFFRVTVSDYFYSIYCVFIYVLLSETRKIARVPV